MAVPTTQRVLEAGAAASVESPRGLIWGAEAYITALPVLTEMNRTEGDTLLYGANADVAAAMQPRRIDAALFDPPTALSVCATVRADGVILGRLPRDRDEDPDRFGLRLREGSALREGVAAALTRLN